MRKEVEIAIDNKEHLLTNGLNSEQEQLTKKRKVNPADASQEYNMMNPPTTQQPSTPSQHGGTPQRPQTMQPEDELQAVRNEGQGSF